MNHIEKGNKNKGRSLDFIVKVQGYRIQIYQVIYTVN